MTSNEFLENARQVLQAAYEYSGINPQNHVSADQCLSKNMKKEEPYRVPLNSKVAKTYSAQTVTGSRPRKELSFIPIHESLNMNKEIQPPRNGLHFPYHQANNSYLTCIFMMILPRCPSTAFFRCVHAAL